MTGRQIAVLAARAAEEKKAQDILIYDLRGASDVTDFFVIATAQSRLQSRAIIAEIERLLKEKGVLKFGQEGVSGGQWVLLDYIEVVIHVFSPDLRGFYNLEALWGDATTIRWQAKPA